MNHPTLYLRPVGFDAQACAALEQQLESCVTTGFQWEITLHPETDVSLVLGDKCTLDYEGTPHAELVVTLPNGGFEITAGYFGASLETCYMMIAVPFETGLTYTYNFTLTIDGQEYTISGKPNEKMSSINNLNMYGIAGIE